MWLDQQTRRRRPSDAAAAATHGGAVVVMDVDSGELVAVASAPRFDPNLLAAGDPRVAIVLADPARPLFDRAAKMALPPGSVFKPLVGLALVSERALDPQASFHCQGYLEDPLRLRCQIYQHRGVGHGDITFTSALSRSCNVYFFHHVDAIGGVRLVHWAACCGFGRPTGVELPDEASGTLPTPDELRGHDAAKLVAVGQGAITATPLQLVRLYAAIANDGYLVTPRIVREESAPGRSLSRRRALQHSERVRIRDITADALDAVRAGLSATVDDPNGTAFDTVRLPDIPIAGKTGTAEAGGRQEDHAWFAGYVPADQPRYAFVVALEHAGNGADVAGPIARKLVECMRELGYFETTETAGTRSPPVAR
jgi:penicillin-binding protein 2